MLMWMLFQCVDIVALDYSTLSAAPAQAQICSCTHGLLGQMSREGGGGGADSRQQLLSGVRIWYGE